MKIPSLPLHKHSKGNKPMPVFSVERLFVQHAVTFFIASTGILLVLFLVFFYLFFYRAVTRAEDVTSDTIHDTQKTVNLGAYGHAVETQRIKIDAGKDYATGNAGIPNPFLD